MCTISDLMTAKEVELAGLIRSLTDYPLVIHLQPFGR